MTSHQFENVLTPSPLCHTELSVLLRPHYIVSQKYESPSPYLSDVIYKQPLVRLIRKTTKNYFSLFQMYGESKEVKKFRNRNAFKVPVSEKVMKMVRANFTREIEFYEFCKQRLEKQFLQIK